MSDAVSSTTPPLEKQPSGDSPTPGKAGTMSRAGLLLLLAGLILTVVALLSEGGRQRIGHGYLLGFTFVWTIVLGSLFFVALQYVTHSVWSVGFRRVAEMLASPMVLLAALFLPLVLFAVIHGNFGVFPWMDPAYVKGDAILEGKVPYLNYRFWLLRAAVFFAIWALYTRFFVGSSLKQDDGTAGVETTLRLRKWSAPFLIIFGLTVTFASFDWLMSLDPQWYSTIYGVYVFSGMTLAALAAITLGVIHYRKQGRIPATVVNKNHLYSLGALLFTFTCFWAYIAFSQYMLIWYANLPEETIWFVHRTENGWMAISAILMVLRFIVPFFLLLSRPSKMDPKRLILASVLILAGQLVDLYWLIMPDAHGTAPRLGVAEIGPTLLLVGIFLLAWARFASRHPMAPTGDPLFKKCVDFHL